MQRICTFWSEQKQAKQMPMARLARESTCWTPKLSERVVVNGPSLSGYQRRSDICLAYDAQGVGAAVEGQAVHRLQARQLQAAVAKARQGHGVDHKLACV
jgi:hypothetical protein